GAERATPAPGVLEAIASADTIICCPSNPVLSVGPILAVPGIERALQSRRDRVIAISPIVGGKALRGPADRLLRELGHEPSASGVARLYLAWVGTIVIDDADKDLASNIEALGMRCVVTNTIMSDASHAQDLARTVVNAL
ncbi:MAG: 2-phospho-L-lactate transferase CofD family protein, partial [Acidimicrobiales bacterium]